MMGKVASRDSDMPVATSDNPRSEDPGSIIRDVLEGMDEGSTAITDRADAIQYAISHAGADDTVLIAGKGHEHYQEIGNERVRFSDFESAEACLEKRRGPTQVRS